MKYKFKIGDLVKHRYAAKEGIPLRGYIIDRGPVEEPIGVVDMYYYRVNWFNMESKHGGGGIIFENGVKFGELVLEPLLDDSGD